MKSLNFQVEPAVLSSGKKLSNSQYDVLQIKLNNRGRRITPPRTTTKIPYIAGGVGGAVWTIYSTVMLAKYSGKIRNSTSSGEVEFYQDYSDSYQFQVPMAVIITAGSTVAYFWDSFSFSRSK